MALTPVKRSDPFDFPPSIVPLGLKYQWVGEMPDARPSFREMRDRGWVIVPPQWHPGVFPDDALVNEAIEVKLNVLMCHACPLNEEAERIAGAQENIKNWAKKFGGFAGGVRIQMQDSSGALTPVAEMRTGDKQLSENVLPSLKNAEPVASIAFNVSPGIPPKRRVPRHRWLAWVFKLISMEQ